MLLIEQHLGLNVIARTVAMSRRKNGVKKEWRKKLTEISKLKNKLRRDPDNDQLKMKINTLVKRVVMPK